MEDVPLSSVTECDGAVRAPPHDNIKDGEAHGTSRVANTMSSASAVICHLILVAFTLYIVILCFNDSYKLFLWHPSLMTIGGFLLMAEAVMAMSQDNPICGRFGRSSRIQIHWILQALAASFIYIGFLVIVINKNLNNKHHFHTWHSIFGLITVIMVGMTSSGGVGALYSVRTKEFIRPALIKLIHNIAGIITYFFGAICMILSMYSDWFTTRESHSNATQVICILLIVLSSVFTLQSAARSAYLKIIQNCSRH
ncbi:hypothetical protein R5R35_009733 [Gryllus longicercus]|uniref:ascorbate ferrireductase (transmembrane) n=1 Tax=Gryllus longicercus TaxID=2509291 RepID=A0AAN9VV12_9ORTH